MSATYKTDLPSPDSSFRSTSSDDTPTSLITKPLPYPSTVLVTSPPTDLRSRLRTLHKWLPSIAGFALSIYSLVTGIDRLKANAYCQHPLAAYLVVSACLGLIQCAVLFVRARAASDVKSRAFRLLLMASLFFFIVMITWTIIGAYWVFSISDSTCDSSLYSSAKSVTIVNIVIIAVVSSSIAYRMHKKMTSPEKEQTDDHIQQLPI